MLKQTLHDEGYKEVAEAFVYTVATTFQDWDLTFLCEHLIDRIAAWRAEHRATHPPADERHVSPVVVRPPSPSTELPAIPSPLPEVHHEQLIEDDPMPVVRAAESDGSVEQIDNPDDVLDH